MEGTISREAGVRDESEAKTEPNGPLPSSNLNEESRSIAEQITWTIFERSLESIEQKNALSVTEPLFTSVDDRLENSGIELQLAGPAGTHLTDHKVYKDLPKSSEPSSADDAEPSDGSDSGLGSDLTEHSCDLAERCSDSGLGSELAEDKSEYPIPVLEDLKTGFDEQPCLSLDEKTCSSTTVDSDNEQLNTPQPDEPPSPVFPVPIVFSQPRKSSLKRKLDTPIDAVPAKKKSITFQGVSVYYFPRTQGFTCIPSQGGSTLGMSLLHSHVKEFSLQEHSVEQRRLHRLMIQRLRSERLTPPSDTDDSESEEEPTDDDDDQLDLDNYYFLQVAILLF